MKRRKLIMGLLGAVGLGVATESSIPSPRDVGRLPILDKDCPCCGTKARAAPKLMNTRQQHGTHFDPFTIAISSPVKQFDRYPLMWDQDFSYSGKDATWFLEDCQKCGVVFKVRIS